MGEIFLFGEFVGFGGWWNSFGEWVLFLEWGWSGFFLGVEFGEICHFEPFAKRRKIHTLKV